MVELRQLLYLNAVYKYRNFTKASKALFVSQPTVSAAIKSLEQELGVVIVQRTSKEVIFTPEGERLMVRIRRLLSDYNDMLEEANDIAARSGSTIRLGIASILSADIFPLIYKEFLPRHEGLSIRLDEDSALGQIEKLLREDLDLAFNGLPDASELSAEIQLIPVCQREIHVVMHRSHRLAALERIPFRTLDGEAISTITAPGVMGQILTRTFAAHQLTPVLMSEHSQMHGMFEMLQTGCSVGFMNLAPGQKNIMKYEDLIVRPFEEPLRFDVGFMMKKHKYLSSGCKELIRFISEELGAK